jgi:hypothetical protein
LGSATLDRPKVVFIVGYPRSGSTILGNVLGEVPGCFHAGELGYVWEQSWRRCGCGELPLDCSFWRAILASQGVHASHPPVDGERSGPLKHLIAWAQLAKSRTSAAHLARLEQVYCAIARRSGCSVVIDGTKRPLDALGVGLLRRRGWDVMFVHLTRNPLEAMISRQRRKLARERNGVLRLRRPILVRDALTWCVTNSATSALLAAFFRQGSTRLRYEQFVQDPRGTLVSIVRCFGEPDDERVTAAFHSNHRVGLTPNHALGGNRSRFSTGDIAISLHERRRKLSSIDRVVTSAVVMAVSWKYGYALPWR